MTVTESQAAFGVKVAELTVVVLEISVEMLLGALSRMSSVTAMM